MWILITLIISLKVKKKVQSFNYNKNEIKQMALICSFIYIIIYFLMGLIIGYTNNPLDRSILGILKNTLAIISVAVCVEIIRTRLLKYTNSKKQWFIPLLVTLVFTVIDINLNSIPSYDNGAHVIINFIFKEVGPSIILNIALSYLVYREGLASALLFKLPCLLVMIITPIYLTNNYAIIFAIQVVVFLIMYINIEKICHHESKFVLIKPMTIKDKIKYGVMVIYGLFLIAFSFKLLSFFPIAIISDSMSPTIRRGDVVVVDKIEYEDIKIGDTIAYSLNNISVVHRVMEKRQNHQLGKVLVTKGDNNRVKDIKYVSEDQILGKVTVIIPKFGYPAILFRELMQKPGKVEVETGGTYE
ncbi:MAG: signal peptidase I [Bacilli bacterium]|nr:signal peptidase I [Bacilli bacterium]